ncbi:HEAT repeat domain-containing protein, partial [Dietzia sp.]|uniref:HEAT repeat domain-containing protein n=1 Tax=Dietzia sp. TaxID=1871616 RepID=UPI002FD91CEF
MIADPDDAVAMSAWRAAVILIPESERERLAWTLAGQLRRGSAGMQRALAMAFRELGGAAEPVLEAVASGNIRSVTSGNIIGAGEGAGHGQVSGESASEDGEKVDPGVAEWRRAHARASLHLLRDPEADFRRLLHIEALRTLGMSLAEMGRALAGSQGAGASTGNGPADVDAGTTLGHLIAETRERIAREQDTLARLERLAAGGPADWAEVLDAIAGISALRGDDPAARQRVALDAPGLAIDASELVAARLAERDDNVAGALGWALARSGDAAAAALAWAARAEGPELRRGVLRALSSLDGDEAKDALLTLLRDPEPDNRSRAALVLARRGSKASREKLLAVLMEGRSDIEAAEALSDLAGGAAGEALLAAEYGARLADPGTAVESRRRLVQALAELGPGAGGRRCSPCQRGDRGYAGRAHCAGDPRRPSGLASAAASISRGPNS